MITRHQHSMQEKSVSKFLVKPFFFAAGLATLQPLAVLAQDTHAADERAIVSLENTFLRARVTGDTASIRSGFASDAVFIHENGDERTRLGLEADVTSQSYWLAYERSEPSLSLYRDAAVTHAVLDIRLGGGRVDKVRTTGVYARQHGTWRIVSWQSTPSLPPDPPAAKP